MPFHFSHKLQKCVWNCRIVEMKMEKSNKDWEPKELGYCLLIAA